MWAEDTAVKFPIAAVLGLGVCPGQLAPNTFTMINTFCHLVKVEPLLEVFSQFYRLTRPKDQVMFSLMPVVVRIEGGASVKFGCFAECKDL